jgi:hypothetical protein
MRSSFVLLPLLLAACKGGKNQTPPERPAPATPATQVAAPLAAPVVGVASVLANVDGPPPHLVLLDGSDQVRIAAAESWDDLDANRLLIARRAMSLGRADLYMRESFALGKAPRATIETLDQASDGELAGEPPVLADAPTAADDADDPPPPDDGVDDGEEGGGTGMAMALDEGKMGQPKLQGGATTLPRDPQRTSLGVRWKDAHDDGKPSPGSPPERAATAEGLVATNGKLDPLRAMVFIAPTAKATKLIDAVSETAMAIAVSHAGKLRPLRLQFAHPLGPTWDAEHWLEVRISTQRTVVEAVPDAPIELTTSDAKELLAALEKARVARGAEAYAPVDLLVDADVEAQRLIDLVVTLDTAGVRLIGMGPMPSAEELAQRGKRVPRALLSAPSVTGDLDRAVLRQVMKARLGDVEACYVAALAGKPQLAGKVMTTFVIDRRGKVSSATASGVDPALAKCIANVIKSLEFPREKKPSRDVVVSYPFQLRS